MSNLEDRRRPIRARSTTWAANIAKSLAEAGLRPNQISVLSIACSAISAACFLSVPMIARPIQFIILIVAAVFIQLRLLCNLFDGMVAVEGGLASKSGEIYNELPDRISDALVLGCAGYATVWTGWEQDLGWLAATLAVITAYTRSLGAQAGAAQQFCGPMAKQQRMFLLTLASVISAFEILFRAPHRAFTFVLILISVGCLLTIFRRTFRIIRELETK